jgi:SAM-dependent methyltransferase
MTVGYTYEGEELGLFAGATNWKRYFRRQIEPHILGDVLEVGAGIGGTTALLSALPHRSWTCLEPDARLAARLRDRIDHGDLPLRADVHVGFLDNLPPQSTFDTILYIDVLEHITDDAGEMLRAAARLRPGGRIVVLCPAHSVLFSEFDRSVGHLRRYSRATLEAVCPATLRVASSFYLDAAGALVSLAARLSGQAMPTPAQIAFWDKVLIPVSRVADVCIRHRLGKTIVVIFARPHA